MTLNLNRLNPKQLEAVKTISGPVQIASVAGSGKTEVLATRIANMIINHDIDPASIMLTTFSKQASIEMRDRLGKYLSKSALDQIVIGTFHSISYRILKNELTSLQHPLKDAFKFDKDGMGGPINDTVKKWYVDEAMKTLKMDTSDKAAISNAEILRIISNAKNNLEDVKSYFEEAISSEDFQIAEVYKLYEDRKLKEKKIDFDDLLLMTYKLFNKYPEILKKYQNKFKYVLVDEAQDNNYANIKLAKMLAKPHNNIMIVGDDDQSLYGFRGAKVNEFIDFLDDYEDGKTIKLEVNYRSTPGILNVANKIITNNSKRLEKQMIPFLEKSLTKDVETGIFENEDLEANEIGIKVAEYAKLGNKFKDISVLYRTNAQTRAIEDVFIRESIPYVIYGGKSFYEIKEIKDLVSYLELIVDNGNDNALKQIINVPTRYLGKVFLNDLNQIARKRNISLFEALKWVNVKPYQQKSVMNFLNLIKNLTFSYKSGNIVKPEQIIQEVIEKINYYELLAKKDNDAEDNDKLTNIESLLAALSKYDSVDDFLSYLKKMKALNKKGADAVQMMTIHRSKGLEYKKVFMTGVSENLLPHKFSLEAGDPGLIEEERRLAYVGVTRARENVHIYSLKSFNGKDITPSRFLEEAELIKVEKS